MRLASLILLGSLAACSGAPNSTSGAGSTDTDTGTGAGTESTSSGAPTSSGGTDVPCEPGTMAACMCGADAGAQVCRPDGTGYEPCECGGGGSMSGSASNSGTGSTGVDTMGTSEGSEGTSASTGGAMCDDPGPEPNDDEDHAIDLPDQDCAAPAKTFSGVLDGAGDADWFSYHGGWQQLCVLGPNTLAKLSASEDVRLCVYASCVDGNASFACKDGVMKVKSPGGLDGCCNTGDVGFDLSCGLVDNSALMFLRVDEAPADACVEYSVEYDFDI